MCSPVSRVASFLTFVAVLPLTACSASRTSSTTEDGNAIEIGRASWKVTSTSLFSLTKPIASPMTSCGIVNWSYDSLSMNTKSPFASL